MPKEEGKVETLISHATFAKYNHVNAHMSNVGVRQKRTIFNYLRESPDHDTFFPKFGFTAGCFCVWQVLNDGKRPRKTRVSVDAKRSRALQSAMEDCNP